MCARLGGDEVRRKPARNRLGKAKDVMRARTGNGQLRKFRAIGVPLKDERLGPIVPQWPRDNEVVVQHGVIVIPIAV